MKTLASKIDRINGNSRTPKYRQVINTILWEIDQGIFSPGQRIPSINETSEEYYLSRDTVEKAYKELSLRGIISSVPGKGYYVNNQSQHAKLKVLAVFNKLSNYKKAIFNAFSTTLGKCATTNLYVHGYDIDYFRSLILDNLGVYDFYVIMPHFYPLGEEALSVLKKVPRNKLIILDKQVDGLSGNFGLVYQDFAKDIEEGLRSGMDLLAKYQKLVLVFPECQPYPLEIKSGFVRFCEVSGMPCELIPSMENREVKSGEAYIVIEEQDLVDLIRQSRESGLQLGQDLGLISYNDTPLKEILSEGITVITTDHARMGQTAADMILNRRREQVRNPFFMIRRQSL